MMRVLRNAAEQHGRNAKCERRGLPVGKPAVSNAAGRRPKGAGVSFVPPYRQFLYELQANVAEQDES